MHKKYSKKYTFIKKLSKAAVMLALIMIMIAPASGCHNIDFSLPFYTMTPRRTSRPKSTVNATSSPSENRDYNETEKPQSTADVTIGDGTLEVHFINVGQGDSIFIRQGDKTMLIDAGERDQGTVVTKYLNKLHIDNIDYLVGTHPHSDHIGGLATVIKSIPVDNAIIPDIEHDTKTYENFIVALLDKEIETFPAEAGDTYSLGDAEFKILAPVRDDYEDLNNWSVVIKLTYGEKSFLFTGDAESLAETDIINSGYDLSADVLKVGHHGSATSSTLKFLKKVSPEYGIISCGVDNSYGHPDPIITKRLANMKITTYSTHTVGTVIVTSDGKTIEIKTEK
ncbi:MAG: MBL fold metallo-hydrolase [Ruminococcaceae bacterium]|nr:MBL fold metallo-hydrolase [Oscillospiraceae bacterium]